MPSFGFEIRTPQERYEHRLEQAARSNEVLRYHEAGHALIAAVLGFKRVVVDMGPDAEGRSLTSYTVPGEWRAPVARTHELTVLYGGVAGECVRFGDILSRSSALDQDNREVRALLTPGQEKSERRAAGNRAVKMVSAQQPWLEWIARQLKTTPYLRVDAHRMADGTLEFTTLDYRTS